MSLRARAAQVHRRALSTGALLVVSALMVVASTVLPSSGASGAAPSGPALSVPTQGVYDQCAPTPDLSTCIEHLQRTAAGGLPVVLNYTSWYASPTDLLAYANAASAAGVKLIWPLNDPVWRGNGDLLKRYPKLAAGCSCTDLFTWLITRLKDHPATWGWYIGDELPLSEAPAATALAARVRAIDPVHPTIYIGMGMNNGRLSGGLTEFQNAGNWLGTDSYPVGTAIRSSITTDIMGAAAKEAGEAGAPMVSVLQAYAHSQYPVEGIPGDHFPTRDEMLDQRNQAIVAAQPKLILWYSLNDIDRSSDPAGNWSALVSAANAPAPTPAAAAATTTTPTVDALTTPVPARKAKAKSTKAQTAKAREKARAARARKARARAAQAQGARS